MRVVVEYDDKRVDIKKPISRHDSKPDTPAELVKLLNEAIFVHGLKEVVQVTND